jgi:hypothetical protein
MLIGRKKRKANTPVCHQDQRSGRHQVTSAAIGSVPLAVAWMNAVKGKTRRPIKVAL